ncbi:hypothetical protein GJ496_001099 [Pomphorhynchus laevis]|nr:hypothetical protein GJ496_001099 [Pomphorhynchus laevis]
MWENSSEVTEETDNLCLEANELLEHLNVKLTTSAPYDNGKNESDSSDESDDIPIDGEVLIPDELDHMLEAKLKNASTYMADQKTKIVRSCMSRISQIANLIEASERSIQSLELIENQFQTNQRKLEAFTSELFDLQSQTDNFQYQLQNNQILVKAIVETVNELSISEIMVDTLIGGQKRPIDIEYIEQVHELMFQRSRILSSEDLKSSDVVFQKTEKVLDVIANQVFTDIKHFISTKIAELRRPMCSVELIHNELLQVKYLFDCIAKDRPESAELLIKDYLDTSGKTSYTYCCMLYSKLMKYKQQERHPPLSLNTPAESQKTKLSLFCMADRDKILNAKYTDHILMLNNETNSSVKYPFEIVFRSVQIPLLDVCCREYMFIQDMFACDKSAFHIMFDRSFSYCYEQTKIWAGTSYDLIGQILCIHFIFKLEVIAHSREVPVVQRFHQSLRQIFEERALHVFDKHCEQLCRSEFNSVDVVQISRQYSELIAAVALLDERLSKKVGGLKEQSLQVTLKYLHGQHIASGIIDARLSAYDTNPLIAMYRELFNQLLQMSAKQILKESNFSYLLLTRDVDNTLDKYLNVKQLMKSSDWKQEIGLLVKRCAKLYCDFLRVNVANTIDDGNNDLPTIKEFINHIKKYKNAI